MPIIDLLTSNPYKKPEPQPQRTVIAKKSIPYGENTITIEGIDTNSLDGKVMVDEIEVCRPGSQFLNRFNLPTTKTYRRGDKEFEEYLANLMN